ncbi:hypothetical protein BCR44DRAFT_1387020 [Catenaria anguillulae PL171]|uniref:DM2 domain-containing protein n=1 Tax=Catenaria anguillulae PL171 TaxID=765915 RepID=A0A1Y2HY83_9FUNG|nr:hypothetical protein BCR44DRAFT_1387020 [Catenaria anguillulae PL171]
MSSAQRKKSVFDRHLPKKVEQLFPESELYSRLQQAERRIDAVVSRKKIEIQEVLGKPIKTRGTLRIFISNYAADQPHMSPASGGTGVPNWTLRIEGRLLDPSPVSDRWRRAKCTPPLKFSQFIQHLIVEIERDPILYPEPNVAEFLKSDRGGNGGDWDGFEVKRNGDEDVKVKVTIRVDYGPEKHKVSRDLAKVLAIGNEGASKVGLEQVMTKHEVVLGIWHYIKHNNLLDSEDKRCVKCDEKLKAVFGVDTVLFAQVPDLITRHLFPPDPIVLHYTVKVDKPFTAAQHVYDIDVEWDDLALKQQLLGIVNTAESDRELSELDAQISATIATINNHRLKRDFMLAFAKDPVAFLNRYMESQARDLQTIVAGASVNRLEARSAEFYAQPWVKDAVTQFLTTKYRA